MRTWIIAFLCLFAVAATEARMRGGVAAPSGMAPAAPAAVNVDQGSASCTNSGSSGCVTGEQDLAWSASSGATHYVVLRNGSTPGSGGCSGTVSATSCADATASNSNCVNTYCNETIYTYQVEACNGSGCSAGTYGANWVYSNGANNSCGNYSGGGFSNYMSTAVLATFTSGQHVFTVTSASTTILPLGGITDVMGAIPTSATTGGPGNPYIEVFGTGGTTGTGGTGTYYLSSTPTSSVSGDGIWSSPAPNVGGGLGAEACPQAQIVESPHSLAMSTSGGAYIQQFTGAPGAPGTDANWGAFNYVQMDLYLTSTGQKINFAVHTRPGAGASGTGDVYSTRDLLILNGTTSSYGTGCGVGVWCTLKIPLPSLGMGVGSFTGYVVANWQGTLSYPGSGSTVTINSTTYGNTSNIASGDYILSYNPGQGGIACFQATSGVSGGTFSATACPVGGLPGTITTQSATDAQAYAPTILTAPGPDNAGLITGQSEPAGVYFSGQTPGSNTANPTGTGHWGLFSANGSQVLSAGSGSGGTCSGSCVTLGALRISSYKPEIFLNVGGDGMPIYIDNYGAVN